MTPVVTVVVATHNPDEARFARVLDALAKQAFQLDWELLLIDNASNPAVRELPVAAGLPSNARVVEEAKLGLAFARRRGFTQASADLAILVDDDNVLATDYLDRAWRLAQEHPSVGAFGGKSTPQFEVVPDAWMREFDGLIACRDPGDVPRISAEAETEMPLHYPEFAPIGAGMCIRRGAFDAWLRDARPPMTDRTGQQLTSGGDNDMVLCALRAGWRVGYFPELALQHLIPGERVTAGYLKRLNRAISKSWMEVLTRHGVNPFPPIASWTVPLRSTKAWFSYRAWQDPASNVRWHGAIGHFEGRAGVQGGIGRTR